jgi:hypothetical protein
MKTVVLFGITLLAAAPAFAQTSVPASSDPANKTVTLTGCVGGGSGSAPITLSQAMILPTTPQPDQTASPLPASASSPVTQPTDATLPPSGTAAVTPSPTGTSGTKMPGPGTAGTTGVMTGTAPAGSSGSSVTGYRLSGADMQPWIGKRVQLVGTFAPAAAAAPVGSTTASPVTGGASTPPALEFRVQAVQPVTGPCSKE